MKKHQSTIRIKPSLSQLHELEGFIENICDDYNIFNSYFGIILFSITESFRAIALQKHKSTEVLRISFASSNKGLTFQFYVGEGILDLAGMLQEDIILSDEGLDDLKQNLQIVKMLSDEMAIDADKGILEIHFNIMSINHHLAKERSKELELYYNRINQTSKV